MPAASACRVDSDTFEFGSIASGRVVRLMAHRRLPIPKPGQSERAMEHLNRRGRKDMQFERSAIDVTGRLARRVSRRAGKRTIFIVSPARVAQTPGRRPALGSRSERKPRSGAACLALMLGVTLLPATGQAQTVEWARSAGSTFLFEQGNGISVDAAGNSHVTGFATGSTMFGPFTIADGGFFVAKYDPSGNVLWARSASESIGGQGNAIVTDASGNSYLTGFFHATMTVGEFTLNAVGAVDIFVAKYDSGGNVLWARSAGSTGFDAGGGITVDASGNCYVAGTFSAMATFGEFTLSSAGVVDIFVAKYDPDGNVLWARSAGGTSDDHGNAIGVDASGNSFVTGSLTGTATFGQITLMGGGTRIFVAKYDPNGDVLWAQTPGGSAFGRGSGIVVDATGNHYVTGSFGFQNVVTIIFGSIPLTSVGGQEIFVVKYDGSGSALWARVAGGTSDDVGTAIAVDAAGNSYVTGRYEDTMTIGSFSLTSAGDRDVFAAKYDPGGNVLWVRSAGGLESDLGRGIGVDAAGNSVVTGTYQSTATFDPFMLTSAGGQDIFVAKYNTCGDGSVDPGEECDGPDDAACPGLCRFDCTCGPGSIIPTVSEWTLIVMTLLGMTAGTVYIRRKPGPVGPTFQSVT